MIWRLSIVFLYIILYSNAYTQELDYNEVIRISNYNLRNDSLNINYLKARAEAFAGIKEYDKALKDYNTIIKNSLPDNQVLYNIGTIMYFLNKLDSAIFYYNESIKLEPSYSDSYYGRGVVYFKKGSYKDAISDYTFFLKNVNYSISDISRANIFNDIGLSHLYLKDYKKAIEYFSSAIKYFELINSYYNRALTKVKINDLNGALIDINKSLEIDSTNQYAIEIMALLQFKLNNSEKACFYLKKNKTLTGFINKELNEIKCH